jgi:hypothetical protein
MGSKKKHGDSGRFVWRDSKTGRYLDVKVAKPATRVRGDNAYKIKEAVEKSGGGSVRKKK